MIAEFRLKGFAPLLLSLPPLDADRYFAWFTRAGLDKASILSWLGDVQHIFRWHEAYDREVRAVAVDEHCALVDIRSAFLAKPDYRTLICQDGIHPNREGHRLINAVLLDAAPMRPA